MIVRLQRPLALHPCPRAIARPLQTCRVLQAKNLPPRPKVDEAEITENFLKGSGPGGQKIVSIVLCRLHSHGELVLSIPLHHIQLRSWTKNAFYSFKEQNRLGCSIKASTYGRGGQVAGDAVKDAKSTNCTTPVGGEAGGDGKGTGGENGDQGRDHEKEKG